MASEDESPLVFQWERRASSRWWLVLMVVLSLLAHAASFYALQVAYTPTGTQQPPPAQVVLVPLDRPENAALARWLAMTDPALATRAAEPAAAPILASLRFRYVPSYDADPPAFKPLDPTAGTVLPAPPRASLPGPVPAPPLPASAADNSAAARGRDSGRTTRLVLTGGIETPADPPWPPVRFNTAEGTKVLTPTVFLVGVQAGGEPFLFRQGSSGDAAADEYARAYLTKLAFRRTDHQAAGWGTAVFYWGSDVYR